MRTSIKMLALGAVAALFISGVALTTLKENDLSAVGADAPTVSVVSLGSDAGEAVMVTTEANGESVPLSGARVMICKMNVTCDGEQTTMRVMETVALQTGEDGKVQYNFSDGYKYMICAENQEQRGFANKNMNQTEAGLCYQHQWDWSHMNGQMFTANSSGEVQERAQTSIQGGEGVKAGQ
ncbi:MAG: hypothetical protein A4E31_01327 [Methanomassiliicoccales archaeon PtaU1.Bin030]|nr:MAG: hypothetical protein A4E31_01327 [Methanomassiliicoccales archaeon PtaU1.Bin030]